jgi:hypothetical protein
MAAAVSEDDCTCDWANGVRYDNPACPYHHPKNK